MPELDEFGREIVGSSTTNDATNVYTSSEPAMVHLPSSATMDNSALLNSNSLSSPRHQSSNYHHSQHRGGSSGGSGSGSGSGYSNSSNRNHYNNNSSSNYNSSSRHYNKHFNSSHESATAPTTSTQANYYYKQDTTSGGGKISTSGNNYNRFHHHHHHNNSYNRHHHHNNNNDNNYKHHVCFKYVTEPLLCQYIFNERNQTLTNSPQQQQQQNHQADPLQQQEEKTIENESKEQEEPPATDANATTNDSLAEVYKEYCKKYCLQYIRKYFNTHLDHDWFRIQYSPWNIVKQQKTQQTPYIQATIQYLLQTVQQQQKGGKGGAFGSASGGASTITTILKKKKNNIASAGTAATSSVSSSSSISDFLQNVNLASSISDDETDNNDRNRYTEHVVQLVSNSTADNNVGGGATDHQQQQQPYQPITAAMVVLRNVPSDVNDEHITIALIRNMNGTIKRNSMTIYNGTASTNVASTTSGGSGGRDYYNRRNNSNQFNHRHANIDKSNLNHGVPYRDVLITGISVTDLITAASAQEKEGETNPDAAAKTVPRKQDDAATASAGVGGALAPITSTALSADTTGSTPTTNSSSSKTSIWIDIECSDAYCRTKYDIDGHGKLPIDGLSDVPERSVHIECCTVPVPTTATTTSTNRYTARKIITLSAALSCSERIRSDMMNAIQLAQVLDIQKQIPENFDIFINEIEKQKQLQAPQQSEQNNDDDDMHSLTNEEKLDIAIAYLRRVHLVLYYNRCTVSFCIADSILVDNNTVHVRCPNADAILLEQKQALEAAHAAEKEVVADEKMTDGDDVSSINNNKIDDNGEDEAMESEPKESEPVVVKDLLVQQQDDAIAKALETAEQSWISDEILQDADAIADTQEETEQRWISDHSLLDEDGRARCSFQFCSKLFKDQSFLTKHILKKHGEYLVAEKAKCHDTYMMKLWDRAMHRPTVPKILVDCGQRFGMVESTVSGGSIPNCIDPEPALWEQQQKVVERERQHQLRRSKADGGRYSAASKTATTATTGGTTFDDVDDVQIEKVKLQFDDDVAVTTKKHVIQQPSKKKKKKRKLL